MIKNIIDFFRREGAVIKGAWASLLVAVVLVGTGEYYLLRSQFEWRYRGQLENRDSTVQTLKEDIEHLKRQDIGSSQQSHTNQEWHLTAEQKTALMRGASKCKGEAEISVELLRGGRGATRDIYDALKQAEWKVGRGFSTAMIGGDPQVLGVRLNISSSNPHCFSDLENAFWAANITTTKIIQENKSAPADAISVVVGEAPN